MHYTISDLGQGLIGEKSNESQYSKEIESLKLELSAKFREVLNTPVSKLKKQIKAEKQAKKIVDKAFTLLP